MNIAPEQQTAIMDLMRAASRVADRLDEHAKAQTYLGWDDSKMLATELRHAVQRVME